MRKSNALIFIECLLWQCCHIYRTLPLGSWGLQFWLTFPCMLINTINFKEIMNFTIWPIWLHPSTITFALYAIFVNPSLLFIFKTIYWVCLINAQIMSPCIGKEVIKSFFFYPYPTDGINVYTEFVKNWPSIVL